MKKYGLTAKISRLAIWLLLPLSLDGLSAPAQSENWVLEDVIVTARKRQETLQSSPVAVSAFSAEVLRSEGIANTRDLERAVPGLNFSEMGSKAPSIFIRGIGQKEAAAALDPGVGVYINSIYIPRTDSQLLDIVDAESVQVLRGPQGTLFGKNNTGGALLITTRAPNAEAVEHEISTRVGNFGRTDFKLSTNLPLVDDTLSARLSVNSTQRDGYLKSTQGNKEYGDEDRLGATARVLWQPSENLSVDTFYYWSKIDENGAALTCYLQNPGGVFNSFTWPGFTETGAFASSCQASQEAEEDDKVTINGPSVFEMTNQIGALTINWGSENFGVKSVTAWSTQDDIAIADDSDGTEVPGVSTGGFAVRGALERSLAAGYGEYALPDDQQREQFSQEFQVSGIALDNRLSYTSGIFLSREDIDNHLTGNLVGFNGYSYKSDVSTLIPKVLASQSDMRNESFAVFAQGTYEFYDWFQLTLGTRYTLEKREREATIYEADCDAIVANALVDNVTDLCAFDVLGLEEPDGFYANPPSFLPVRLVEEFETLEGDVITAVDGKVAEDEDWSEWTPTITSSFNIPGHFLQDTAIDSTLIYLTYSKGFKSGGFEMKGLEVFEFKPEKVTNYELGIKIDAFDERLRLNSAFYYMDYDDIQIRITEQGRSFADILIFIDNAGAATIQGFELEMTALPLKNVVLTATASYTDANYDEFIASDVDTDVTPPVQTQVDRSNEDFAAIPKLTYSLAASVTLPTSIGNLTPSLSMYFRDNLYTGLDASAWDPEFRDLATLDDVTLWNFRLGFIPANSDKLQLWFYVDNLTDEDYFQGGFSNTESLGAGSYVKGTPRSYGLEASYSF